MLVHVIDRSSPVYTKQRETVLRELDAIGCGDTPVRRLSRPPSRPLSGPLSRPLSSSYLGPYLGPSLGPYLGLPWHPPGKPHSSPRQHRRTLLSGLVTAP